MGGVEVLEGLVISKTKAPLVKGVMPNTLSIRHALVLVTLDATVQSWELGPKLVRLGEKPKPGYVVEYVTSAVLRVRTVLAPADSFAAIRALIKFGIAIAAIIKMIATTISNSIKEKPFFLCITESPLGSLLISSFSDT